MATQKLLLRQLYMPLRIEVEPTKQGEGDDAALARLEAQREIRRHREAGHLLMDEPERSSREISRAPVGERLAASSRLVVLGDPGGGKTTMLRWMATAYLLRHKGDAAFSEVPDTKTLPAKPWIPVFIRCRDLGDEHLSSCFVDFLTQHLNKELRPEEAAIMRAVILDRIAKGEALLLVDGLDEIANTRVRMMFCQELERAAVRYPDAPIVVTSRIVGYRDMPYRMGSGFEHGQIAELNREDKDLFARRWVEVTEQHQTTDEKAKRAQELLDALHSNDRIERLTGNPMLLTTLALVKRKVGKLPNKRTKLYAEAVSVLLNWNPRLYETIEEDEAIPQLEYLAFEMCRRGVQRLADDEVLDLLDKLRVEYPNIRPIKRREPHAFLKHLEERSSILIKSGGIWQKNTTQEKPVWEFRHLTFQEYLAARALLDGRYPGRDKTKSLAEHVAPLAGAVQKAKGRRPGPERDAEAEVPESWREALRLLVADCKDDDVEDVLQAILTPTPNEDGGKTSRPRAVLAALCLADEPNISEESASAVLTAFASSIRSGDAGRGRSSLAKAASIEVGRSIWSPLLKKCLLEQSIALPGKSRLDVSGVWGAVESSWHAQTETEFQTWIADLNLRLRSNDRVERLSAIVTAMYAAFEQKDIHDNSLVDALMRCCQLDAVTREAAVLALLWLSGGWLNMRSESQHGIWEPSDTDFRFFAEMLTNLPPEESECRRFLVTIVGKGTPEISLAAILKAIHDADDQVRQVAAEALGRLGDKQAVAPLLAKLDDQDKAVRRAVIGALGQLRDKQAVAPLLAKLDDPDTNVRRAVIRALGQLGDKQAVAPLLAKLDDPDQHFRWAVIEALAQLGDKQAVAPLLAKLDDQDPAKRASVAAALHALGEPKGTAALKQSLTSEDAELRRTAVSAYARQRDVLDQRLLSRDFDGADPWLDPQEPVTDAQVTNASSGLNLTPDQVRSRYEALAVDLNLKLSWKS